MIQIYSYSGQGIEFNSTTIPSAVTSHLFCFCTGKAHILEVLNALYHELAACEILSTGGPLERTPSQQSLNALIISC